MLRRAAIICAAFLLAGLAMAQNLNHWENLYTATDPLDGSETLILMLTTGTCLSGPTPVPDDCQRFVTAQDIADFIGAGTDTFLAVEVDGTPVSTAAPTLNFLGVDFVLVESPADTFALTVNSGIARDTELHVAVVLAGTPNYIVVSGPDNQTLTLGLIDLATDVTGALPLTGDVSGAHSANQVDSVQPNSVALSTDTTGNYAAGDAEAGNATSLAADALDAMAEIAAGIKRGPDATDTHLLTTDVAAPGSADCLEMDTDGSVILSGAPCGGGAFDDSGDPIVPNDPTKDLVLGDGVTGLTGKVEIGGDADQPQVVIEGAAVQTDDIFIIRDNAGTEVFRVSASGIVSVAGSSRRVDVGGGGSYRLGPNDIISLDSGRIILRGLDGVQFLLSVDEAGSPIFDFDMNGPANLTASSGDQIFVGLFPDYDQTSTAGGIDFEIDRTETALGSGPQLFTRFRRDGTDQLTINRVGTLRGLAANSAVSVSAGDDAAGNLGALTSFKSATATINSSAGGTLTASNLIPAGAFLMGLTARITTSFGTSTGLTDFDVGDGSDVDRWANSLAITSGTTMDLTNATANASGDFPAAQDVVLTAVGGDFDGDGVVELLAHIIQLTAPTG